MLSMSETTKGAVTVPYEICRSWPDDWDLTPSFEQSAAISSESFSKGRCKLEQLMLPHPARYLHPSVEIQMVPGRHRGIVALEPLQAGELLLVDSPLIIDSSFEALLQSVSSRATENLEFRRNVLSMCGDPEDEVARNILDVPPELDLLRNILRHNYHCVDLLPIDGALVESELTKTCGLWPLGSLINHSLQPNVARSFAGLSCCYRLIRPLRAGEEVLDNYLDLRFPMASRQEMLTKNHNMTDEGPDAFDAPVEFVAKFQGDHESMSKPNDLESAQSCFVKLAELTNSCPPDARDPAFSDVFRDFALIASELGDAEMSLNGFAQAIELATAREPFSLVSYLLAMRMVHVACLAREDVDGDTRRSLETLAREHFRMVYGPWPKAFEALNPTIISQLVELEPSTKHSVEDDHLEFGADAKRTRKD